MCGAFVKSCGPRTFEGWIAFSCFFQTLEPNSLEAVYRGCVSQFVRIGCEGRQATLPCLEKKDLQLTGYS